MAKAKLLLVLAFVVVCAAGVVVGTAMDRHVRPVPVAEPPHGPFAPLGLSSDQEKALKQAWEPVGKFRGEMFHKRHELDDQRWAAVQAMFTPEQKTKFDDIQAAYKKQLKELDGEFSARVESAVNATKTILTPEQFQKWTDMRKQHDHGPGHDMGGPPPGMSGMGGPPGHGRRGDHRRSGNAPTTGPGGDPSETRPTEFPPPPAPQ